MVKIKEVLLEIGRMSIEEKLARLSDVDKAYVQGYVERAVLELQKEQNRQAETLPEAEKQEIAGALIPERITEGEKASHGGTADTEERGESF